MSVILALMEGAVSSVDPQVRIPPLSLPYAHLTDFIVCFSESLLTHVALP